MVSLCLFKAMSQCVAHSLDVVFLRGNVCRMVDALTSSLSISSRTGVCRLAGCWILSSVFCPLSAFLCKCNSFLNKIIVDWITLWRSSFSFFGSSLLIILLPTGRSHSAWWGLIRTLSSNGHLIPLQAHSLLLVSMQSFWWWIPHMVYLMSSIAPTIGYYLGSFGLSPLNWDQFLIWFHVFWSLHCHLFFLQGYLSYYFHIIFTIFVFSAVHIFYFLSKKLASWSSAMRSYALYTW